MGRMKDEAAWDDWGEEFDGYKYNPIYFALEVWCMAKLLLYESD